MFYAQQVQFNNIGQSNHGIWGPPIVFNTGFTHLSSETSI